MSFSVVEVCYLYVIERPRSPVLRTTPNETRRMSPRKCSDISSTVDTDISRVPRWLSFTGRFEWVPRHSSTVQEWQTIGFCTQEMVTWRDILMRVVSLYEGDFTPKSFLSFSLLLVQCQKHSIRVFIPGVVKSTWDK